MSRARERAVVIGSGISGLTAAAVLAKLDYRVEVLEKAPVTAPLLRGFIRRGVYCDVGLHYTGGFSEQGLMTRLLDRLGMGSEIEAVEMDCHGFDRIIWSERGLDLSVPVGLARVQDLLRSHFPRSRVAVDSYLDVVCQGLEQTPFLNPEVAASQLEASRYERITVAEFLRREGAEEDLVRLLGDYGAMLFGCRADEAPLRTHSLVLGSYFQSAHTIRGGGKALADAFVRRIRSAGGELRTGCAASSIEIGGDGMARGVRLGDGELVEAEQVIFTAPPAALPAMLPDEGMRTAYLRKLGRMTSTPGMLVGFIESGVESRRGHHNTYLMLDRAQVERSGFEFLAVMAGSPPAPGVAASFSVIRDVSCADFGQESSSHFSARPADYGERKLRLLEQGLDVARELLGAEELAGEVVEILTPYSFQDWTGTPGGSAYGLKRPVKGRRLHPLTPVPNLLLAGQSLLYPGIMGAVASALVTCGLIVGHETLWRRILR